MKKLLILLALMLIPAFAQAADVTGPFEYKLQCVSHISSTVTGTTAETAFNIGTCTIPGGALGTSGTLYIRAMSTQTNNSNAKSLKIKLGSTIVNTISVASSVASNVMSFMSNRNSLSSQVTYANSSVVYGTTTASLNYINIDTSAAQTLTVTMTLGTPTDSVVLEALDVWIMRP